MNTAENNSDTAIIITSIASPNAVMQSIAAQCIKRAWHFIVAGDHKSPPDFKLEGCDFYDIKAQHASGFLTAKSCPKNHYARKNIAYLIAMQGGAKLIIETDDDNMPLDAFFAPRQFKQQVTTLHHAGWVNAYAYFSDEDIWPRGLPLDVIRDTPPSRNILSEESVDCPIQQGLANANPDVDAIYRLLFPLPRNFRAAPSVALGQGSWCPFNSQNTTWFPPVFPLLYLPAYCSFRMTDIWRSFVAQRILFENNWHFLFHAPTVIQDRNEHDLMRDFADEVPGYLNNGKIRSALEDLSLKEGSEHIPDNMRQCYGCLVAMGVVGEQELALLNGWLEDIANLNYSWMISS